MVTYTKAGQKTSDYSSAERGVRLNWGKPPDGMFGEKERPMTRHDKMIPQMIRRNKKMRRQQSGGMTLPMLATT